MNFITPIIIFQKFQNMKYIFLVARDVGQCCSKGFDFGQNHLDQTCTKDFKITNGNALNRIFCNTAYALCCGHGKKYTQEKTKTAQCNKGMQLAR